MRSVLDPAAQPVDMVPAAAEGSSSGSWFSGLTVGRGSPQPPPPQPPPALVFNPGGQRQRIWTSGGGGEGCGGCAEARCYVLVTFISRGGKSPIIGDDVVLYIVVLLVSRPTLGSLLGAPDGT